MSAPALEAFLARIYVDAEARTRFLADPRGEAARAGLTPEECDALARIDRVGLDLCARSFARKRQARLRQRGRNLASKAGWWDRLCSAFCSCSIFKILWR
jgi:hypothetical protein